MDKPYINTSLTRLRRKVKSGTESEYMKNTAKTAINLGVEDFLQRIETGEVKINNVNDFEKLVKTGLLVYGEPTEIREETSDIIGVDEFEAITDTEEFEKLAAMLSESLGERNEKE